MLTLRTSSLSVMRTVHVPTDRQLAHEFDHLTAQVHGQRAPNLALMQTAFSACDEEVPSGLSTSMSIETLAAPAVSSCGLANIVSTTARPPFLTVEPLEE